MIRTVNFLNRLLFKPDHYVLGIKPPGEKAKFAEVFAERVDNEDEESGKEEVDLVPTQTVELKGDPAALVDLLISHSAAIIAKGDPQKQRY